MKTESPIVTQPHVEPMGPFKIIRRTDGSCSIVNHTLPWPHNSDPLEIHDGRDSFPKALLSCRKLYEEWKAEQP